MKIITKYLIVFLSLIQLISCKTLDLIDVEKNKYDIIKESQGDINIDGITDTVILISKDNSDKGIIIILISDSNGFVSQKFVNENLTEGFIELYNELPDLEIKNGELLISYYGGMCFRAFRTMKFKFNKDLNNLYFDSILEGGHNVCNDSEYETETYTSKELKKITFEKFIDRI